jgi:hypothetical protein
MLSWIMSWRMQVNFRIQNATDQCVRRSKGSRGDVDQIETYEPHME